MGFFDKIFGKKNKGLSRAEIEERLKHYDLKILRNNLVKMLQTREGYWEPNLHKAMMSFINDPRMETAIDFVQKCGPDMLPLIENMAIF